MGTQAAKTKNEWELFSMQARDRAFGMQNVNNAKNMIK